MVGPDEKTIRKQIRQFKKNFFSEIYYIDLYNVYSSTVSKSIRLINCIKYWELIPQNLWSLSMAQKQHYVRDLEEQYLPTHR